MLEELVSQAFWIGLAKIIGVNVILSGDNAVVIALAARSLPPQQQKKAVFWGAGAAVILRIILTIFAVALLTLPWLKLVADHALAGWLTKLGVQYRDDTPYVGGYSLELIAAAIGFVLVVALGKWLAKRKEGAAAEASARNS